MVRYSSFWMDSRKKTSLTDFPGAKLCMKSLFVSRSRSMPMSQVCTHGDDTGLFFSYNSWWRLRNYVHRHIEIYSFINTGHISYVYFWTACKTCHRIVYGSVTTFTNGYYISNRHHLIQMSFAFHYNILRHNRNHLLTVGLHLYTPMCVVWCIRPRRDIMLYSLNIQTTGPLFTKL